MCNECEGIYRCGCCGVPTDDKGLPLAMDPDEASDYIKKHKDYVNVSTSGHCCADEHATSLRALKPADTQKED